MCSCIKKFFYVKNEVVCTRCGDIVNVIDERLYSLHAHPLVQHKNRATIEGGRLGPLVSSIDEGEDSTVGQS